MRKLLFISVFLFFLCPSIYALDNGYEFTSEFQINQTAVDAGDIAAASNDTNYLVLWHRKGVVGRFLNADTTFESDEVSFSSGVAITSDSTNFLLAGEVRPSGDIDYSDIYAMLVSNDGSPLTTPFLVHDTDQNSQRDIVLASNQSNYFSVWTEEIPFDGIDPDFFDFDIHGQFIDLSGNKIGQELTINTYTEGVHRFVSVASNGDTYLVAWGNNYHQSGNTNKVVGRMFSSSGEPLGDTFTIGGETTSGRWVWPVQVASNGEDYLVAWAAPVDIERNNIVVRMLDASGNPIGSELIITTTYLSEIHLAGNENGFLITWRVLLDYHLGTSYVAAQILDVNGFKLGSPFTVYADSSGRFSVSSRDDQFLFLREHPGNLYGKFLNPMASDVVITQQSQAVTGYVGESVTVSVTASSPNGALTYQWYKNHEPIGTSSSSVIISDLDNDDNGALIYCDISDNSGFVRSSAAELTVLQPAFTISIAGSGILFGGNTAQYTATALYSDGSSYNVSDYVTWSITPGTLGEIDASGRLTVDPVSSFQQVLVQASLYDGYYDETHTGQKTVDINIPFNVTSMSVTPGSVETSAPLEIDIVCSDAVDGSLVNSSTCALIKAGHDGEFGTGDDSVLPVSAGLLTPAVIRLDLSSLTLPNDDYMVLLSGIKNTHGALLDGEYLDILPSGDNHPGGDFAAEFTISRSVASDIIFNDNDTVTLSWEPFRDGTVYRVDVTDDGTTWAPVDPVEQWPITATTWTGGAWKGYAMRLFRVVGVAPYISMIDPDYGMQDTFSMFVDITGYGISFPENETQVSFGDGILVVAVTADGSEQISVEIRISATAEPGMRDVVVTTPEKTYIKPAGFEVR